MKPMVGANILHEALRASWTFSSTYWLHHTMNAEMCCSRHMAPWTEERLEATNNKAAVMEDTNQMMRHYVMLLDIEPYVVISGQKARKKEIVWKAKYLTWATATNGAGSLPYLSRPDRSWSMCFSCICLFILHALIFVFSLFLFVSGFGCGFWLWHFLDSLLTFVIICKMMKYGETFRMTTRHLHVTSAALKINHTRYFTSFS